MPKRGMKAAGRGVGKVRKLPEPQDPPTRSTTSRVNKPNPKYKSSDNAGKFQYIIVCGLLLSVRRLFFKLTLSFTEAFFLANASFVTMISIQFKNGIFLLPIFSSDLFLADKLNE